MNTYLYIEEGSVDYNKVLDYTKQILNDFPFNIEQIYITGVAKIKESPQLPEGKKILMKIINEIVVTSN